MIEHKTKCNKQGVVVNLFLRAAFLGITGRTDGLHNSSNRPCVLITEITHAHVIFTHQQQHFPARMPLQLVNAEAPCKETGGFVKSCIPHLPANPTQKLSKFLPLLRRTPATKCRIPLTFTVCQISPSVGICTDKLPAGDHM